MCIMCTYDELYIRLKQHIQNAPCVTLLHKGAPFRVFKVEFNSENPRKITNKIEQIVAKMAILFRQKYPSIQIMAIKVFNNLLGSHEQLGFWPSVIADDEKDLANELSLQLSLYNDDHTLIARVYDVCFLEDGSPERLVMYEGKTKEESCVRRSEKCSALEYRFQKKIGSAVNKLENIAKSCIDKVHTILIMDYYPHILLQPEFKNNNQWMSALTTLLKILTVLRRNKIVHCDIKPQNIFVDKNKNIRLGDFGSAMQLDRDIKPSQPVIEKDRWNIDNRSIGDAFQYGAYTAAFNDAFDLVVDNNNRFRPLSTIYYPDINGAATVMLQLLIYQWKLMTIESFRKAIEFNYNIVTTSPLDDYKKDKRTLALFPTTDGTKYICWQLPNNKTMSSGTQSTTLHELQPTFLFLRIVMTLRTQAIIDDNHQNFNYPVMICTLVQYYLDHLFKPDFNDACQLIKSNLMPKSINAIKSKTKTFQNRHKSKKLRWRFRSPTNNFYLGCESVLHVTYPDRDNNAMLQSRIIVDQLNARGNPWCAVSVERSAQKDWCKKNTLSRKGKLGIVCKGRKKLIQVIDVLHIV